MKKAIKKPVLIIITRELEIEEGYKKFRSNPILTYYDVEITTDDKEFGIWKESFPTKEARDVFMLGLKVASNMTGENFLISSIMQKLNDPEPVEVFSETSFAMKFNQDDI